MFYKLEFNADDSCNFMFDSFRNIFTELLYKYYNLSSIDVILYAFRLQRDLLNRIRNLIEIPIHPYKLKFVKPNVNPTQTRSGRRLAPKKSRITRIDQIRIQIGNSRNAKPSPNFIIVRAHGISRVPQKLTVNSKSSRPIAHCRDDCAAESNQSS